jgi:3-methyladenine DNA glycosylase AlkC
MSEPLKNYYNQQLINKLAGLIAVYYKPFNQAQFVSAVFNKDWDKKELKQRMRHITHCLHQAIPLPYAKQIDILKNTAPHFNGFIAMFFPDFVEVNGLNNFEVSIDALTHFTQFSSSEFAVRPFIIKYQKQMINQHLIWSKHKNYHVRRLASEGIRPRLPWAIALPNFKKDPATIIPILNNLMADEHEYVRRSVANCINDISKDHPQIVIDLVKNNKNKSTETGKLLKHASRGLLKKGNAEILKLFDLNNEHLVKLLSLQIDKLKIQIGQSFNFNLKIQLLEKEASQIRLEFNIYYKKANGKQSAKIFQIGTYLLQPNQTVEVNKKHSFINLTTRKHYEGTHKIAIVANGNEIGFLDFELLG